MHGVFLSTRLFIGLMSGTSVDAIDAALVEIWRSGRRYGARVLAHAEHAWPAELRRRLLAAMAPAQVSTAEICELNFAVAREFAAAVERVLGAGGVARTRITAIGSHGQTICHLPVKTQNSKRKTQNGMGMGSTLQIGDPSVIAVLTGIATAGDFRAADMAVGGQGAPLVPWADAMLLSHAKKARCVQNIGGIANVTFLPAGETAVPRTEAKRQGRLTADHEVIAFDTGPGNMLMDAAVSWGTGGRERFDKNGRLAARGVVDDALFRWLQGHSYFRREPPKSTGREEFGEAFLRQILGTIRNRKLRIENLLRTLARLTAWSIADAYARFLPRFPDEVILCGGGADNPVLVEMLAEELRSAGGRAPQLRRIEAFGIPNKAKEAASFALLAAATVDGVPANLLSVTGAKRRMVLGVVGTPLK